MSIPHIAVDRALVAQYIAEFAEHGAYGATGVWRTVYSPEWNAAATQFEHWGRAAGFAVRRDAVGNVWARSEGADNGGVIATGSHIDSQRPGGQYDGALGALGALIAVQTLKERFGTPTRTLEAVALCEEEASRFPTAEFWGSRAICGLIAADEPETVRGFADESIGDAMRAVGLDPAEIPSAKRTDIDAFLELHIEQGPVLEQAGLPVGIVTGIAGIRHYVVELVGDANHAGAFPMDLRRDPMAGAAEMISGVLNNAYRMGRPAVTTVGRIEVEPGGPAIVPARVTFMIDARHADPAARLELYRQHESLVREVAARRNLGLTLTALIDQEPGPCNPELVALLTETARDLGIPTMPVASGALHDSLPLGRHFRTAMIFVRSKDGRSHTPDEYSSTEDCASGIDLLASALYRLAY